MPLEGSEIVAGGGIISGAVAFCVTFYKFFSKFQTRKLCEASHAEHDRLEDTRQKLRDEKLGRIHDSCERTEKLVMKMADDFYEPRNGQKTRSSD